MAKAILVDVDNTIFDFPSSSLLALKRSADIFGIKLPDNILPIFLKHNNALWDRIEEKTLTFSELQHIRFNEIFKEIGIEGVDGYSFELLFDEIFEECAVEVEGIRTALSYLKDKGYILAIASNASKKQQIRRLQSTSMLSFFSAIFTSGELGVSKPNAEFFRKCLKDLRLKPEEAIMLGDSLKADIIGAKEAGITTIWFDRRDSGDSEYADYKITSPLELLSIL